MSISIPKYPPICSTCRNELTRADMVGVGYDPCPRHPRAYIQVTK
jgi:hypothetical protein